MSMAKCAHQTTPEAPARASACEACGSTSNLRACTTCGHVGCCESQLGHNTAHARASGHPVIRALTPRGDGFLWCYACEAYVR